ncbi:MAG: ABC transporter ATP-binding protein [Spirochaetia bacterium]|jgi:ABC-2 type transport system ATP-binding protein|nr:ABC transporter ATP-binding protein [Spirochaetia bacterium]
MLQMQTMTFGYGKKPLFEGFDLSLEPGSINGLLGLNGAGKTSLLKIAAGALRPTLGRVEVFGRDPSRREASFLADVAFVPEDPWFPALKPAAWVDRIAIFRPGFDRRRFESLSDELGLEADKVVSKFSYGQRKKFALAAAIASGARLLLLDEPTNGLDIPSKVQFRRVLASAVGPDRIVVVSTHQVRDLENLIDPIIIVNRGKVAFSVTASELGARLRVERLSSLAGRQVVYAERDAVGWTALLSAESKEGVGVADLELVFNAAIGEPGRLEAALSGQALSEYKPVAADTNMGDE